MSIHLDIVTIERIVVSEEVDYVSAPGIDGVLGILPQHEPLLTALSIGELHYRQGNTNHSFAIGCVGENDNFIGARGQIRSDCGNRARLSHDSRR